jgi:hypothetical protein
VALIIVAVVVGIAVLFGVSQLFERRRQEPPAFNPFIAENDEQRRRDIMEAFRNQRPLAGDEIVKELKPGAL